MDGVLSGIVDKIIANCYKKVQFCQMQESVL